MYLYIISLVFLVGLIVALVFYSYAKNKNKKMPDTYSESAIKTRFTFVIVFLVLTLLPLVPIFGVLFLFAGVFMYVIPIVCLIALIIMIVKYISAKRENKEDPGTYSEENLRVKLIAIIILAILTVLPLIALFGFILLMNLGIFGM